MNEAVPDAVRRGAFWSGARAAGAVPIRFFNIRFRYVHEHLDRVEERLRLLEGRPVQDAAVDHGAGITEALEATAMTQIEMGRALRSMLDDLHALGSDVAEIAGAVARDETPPIHARGLSGQQRAVLHRSASHDGYAAEAGLWFNPPLSLWYDEEGARIENVNERIAETPFVLAGVGRLSPGARVLDVGARESMLSLQLASLGYQVTALDPRGYPLAHPGLDVLPLSLSDLPDDHQFDAVVCLSTIEHLGIGAYGLEDASDADVDGMATILSALRPGGLLLLTTPYGTSFSTNRLERIYDAAALHRLLDGFEVESISYLIQRDPLVWERAAEPAEDPTLKQVALVSAHRPAL